MYKRLGIEAHMFANKLKSGTVI